MYIFNCNLVHFFMYRIIGLVYNILRTAKNSYISFCHMDHPTSFSIQKKIVDYNNYRF